MDLSVRTDQLYHFKVLKLRSHSDTNEGPEVTLAFHFFHKLFANNENEFVKDLHWTLNKDVQQRLYLSQNTHRLLEVINQRLGIIY